MSKLAIHHPALAGFLVRLESPGEQGPNMLEFARRDIEEGFRQERSRRMPMALAPALNIIVGAVPGATDRMLKSDCEEYFSEQAAAAALRTPGVDVAVANVIGKRHLDANKVRLAGMLGDTLIGGEMEWALPEPEDPTADPPHVSQKNTQSLQSIIDDYVNMTIYSL